MTAKKTLLVEGKDDEHVLKAVCGRRNGPHFNEVKVYEGVDLLLESLPVRLKASGDGEIIGVVIDADTDLEARWRSIRNGLIQVGYHDAPESPSPNGTIVDPPTGVLLPRVGIWIMPDNQSTGILESFLRFLVPAGSGLFNHVESSVAAIPEGELRFNPLAKPKALIHTWLAWQEEPGRPMGTAITARFLDYDVAQVSDLVNWLNQLYLV